MVWNQRFLHLRGPLRFHLRHGSCFYRGPCLARAPLGRAALQPRRSLGSPPGRVAYYRRCYEPGTWLPAPIPVAEPPIAPPAPPLPALAGRGEGGLSTPTAPG